MAKVPNAVKILPKIWTAWVGRTNVTDDRRMGDSIANVNSRSRSLKWTVMQEILSRSKQLQENTRVLVLISFVSRIRKNLTLKKNNRMIRMCASATTKKKKKGVVHKTPSHMNTIDIQSVANVSRQQVSVERHQFHIISMLESRWVKVSEAYCNELPLQQLLRIASSSVDQFSKYFRCRLTDKFL